MQIQFDSPSERGWTAEVEKEKKDQIAIQEDIIETEVVNVHENLTAIIGALFFFSICGVLIRIGLNRLELYDGQPVIQVMYAQFTGCVIIGFLLEFKIRIESKYHTVFVGMSTGLCGSITTFSGVILVASKEFYNIKNKNRDTFHSILGGLGVLMVCFGLSFIGFTFGRHIAMAFVKAKDSQNSKIQKLKYLAARCFHRATINKVDCLLIVLGLASYAVTIALVIAVTSGRDITFSMLFAPFGTLLRWRLGKLNPKFPRFPLGTFIVNIGGSLILVIFYLLGITIIKSMVVCDVFFGIMDGFCGCLTTISTFVVESTGLDNKYGYRYAVISIVVAQVIMAVGFGIYVGTGRVTSTFCSGIV